MIPTFTELIIPEAPPTIAEQIKLVQLGLKPAVMVNSPIRNHKELLLSEYQSDDGQWFYLSCLNPRMDLLYQTFYSGMNGIVLGYPTGNKPKEAKNCLSLINPETGLEILSLAYDEPNKQAIRGYLLTLIPKLEIREIVDEPITSSLQRRLLNWSEYLYSL